MRGLHPHVAGAGSLDHYLASNWALVVAHTKCGIPLTMMRELLSWYSLRHKTIYVDRLSAGDAIRSEAFARAGIETLPLLFVDKQCVGDLAALRGLDAEAKLKDVLHFGFKWPDLHTDALRNGPYGRVSMLRSSAGDEEFFHGTYRGAPVTAPVGQLPKFTPHSPR